jgi:hypothetical protein
VYKCKSDGTPTQKTQEVTGSDRDVYDIIV